MKTANCQHDGWAIRAPDGEVCWRCGVWPHNWQPFVPCGVAMGMERADLGSLGWSAVHLHIAARVA